MKEKLKVLGVYHKVKEGRLNIYNINYLSKSGRAKTWNLASRKEEDEFMKGFNDKSKLRADGIVICATHRETGRLVILKQFRVETNSDMITLPGGIVDEGETYEETAIRELKEETNLDLIKIDKSRGLKPRYSASGVTDETVAIVYGECTGIPDEYMKGDSENGEVILASPRDIEKILADDKTMIGGRTELILENYLLQADKYLKPIYTDMETAMNSGKRIKPKDVNVKFLTSEEAKEFLNNINEVFRDKYEKELWISED